MTERSEVPGSTVALRHDVAMRSPVRPKGAPVTAATDQHELVSRLRRQVALLIGDEVDRREREGLDPLDDTDRRMMADAEIRRTLTDDWRTRSRRGEAPLTHEQEEEVAEAVITSVFSALPGLDEYLAREDVTDVFINGCDDVRLRTMDGEEIVVPPLVGSDAELVTLIQGLARRRGRLGAGDAGTPTEVGGDHEKEFNASTPLLNLRLSDGSRLAAAAWVTNRPYVSIRRHPLADAAQKDLVARGMYGEGVASLLAAAVRARKTIMIAGGQGRGKTTLMRALLHECDPSERIMVLEQEPELQLDADPVRHNQVLSWIARPANMEGEGAVTLADLAWAIKRHAPDRIVVGEVLGAEVMVMLEAVGQGIAGALCTMHAKDAYRVFGRMVHYAQLGQPTITPDFVLDTAADALDLVVYLDVTPDGRRVVSEIAHVRGFDARDRIVVADEWYVPGSDRAALRNPLAPPPAKVLDELVAYGYDPSLEPGW